MTFATERAHKALPPADRKVRLPLRPDAAAGSEQHQAALQFAAGAGASLDEDMQVRESSDNFNTRAGRWALPVDAHCRCVADVQWFAAGAREARIPMQTGKQPVAFCQGRSTLLLPCCVCQMSRAESCLSGKSLSCDPAIRKGGSCSLLALQQVHSIPGYSCSLPECIASYGHVHKESTSL